MNKRSRLIFLTLILSLVILVAGVGLSLSDASSSLADANQQLGEGVANQQEPDVLSTTTISGTVSGPDGAVEGVRIIANGFIEVQEDTTDSNGYYSVTVQHDGVVIFHVRPPLEAPLLSQANYYINNISGDFTKDVTLSAAYLMQLTVDDSAGSPITSPLQLETIGLISLLPDNQWYQFEKDEEGGVVYHAALPPDIYYIYVSQVPAGSFDTNHPFDLRSGDQSVILTLNDHYVHPIPYDPPDASKITIGQPDDLGEALVSGEAGAALPLARVVLVNMGTTHQEDTISEADGSFSARIYAPPGSAIQIKHGPASERWRDLKYGLAEGINPFPGTTIHAPFNYDDGDPETLSFATVGLVEGQADDKIETLNYVGAAWAITGTMKHATFDGSWSQVISGTYGGQNRPGLYLGGLNWTHPALGDLDDDGDLDMLVGERAGSLVLYRNEGSPTVPDWLFEEYGYAGVTNEEWAYPTIIDVTNDNALDLFVGKANGDVDIYINQGTPENPLWPQSPQETLVAGPQPAPALADLNNNGVLDLVVGIGGGTLIYFQNNGTVSVPDWADGTPNYGGISGACESIMPAFIDLNQDSRLDILLGCDNHLLWYAQGGPLNAPTWTLGGDNYMGVQSSSGLSPGLGDWDNDGDLDLVTGEHWGNRRFFINHLNEVSSDWEEIQIPFPFDLEGDSAPALADFSGDDGLPDLLIGQVHGMVIQYNNTGTAGQANWSPLEPPIILEWTNHPHAFPTLGDLNGDGLVDVLVGEGGWPEGSGAGGTLYYYENSGSAATPDWTSVITTYANIDLGGWSAPALVDIDDDNDLDLFVGNEEGFVTFFENVGDLLSADWESPMVVLNSDFGSYAAPAFLDLDQDNDLDMLIGLGDGSLTHLENVGSASIPEWELAANNYYGIDVGRHAMPTAADVNGDGLDDMLLGGEDGGLHLYLFETGGPPVPTDPHFYAPGDLVKIEGALQLHSQAITNTTDAEAIIAWGGVLLQKIFNADGTPIGANNYFYSTMLTPSGFPIQRGGAADIDLKANYQVKDLTHIAGNTIAGQWGTTFQLPANLEPGIYRPVLTVHPSDVPTSTQWLAAYVTNYLVAPETALLPPIQVGDVAQPRLIWRLLMDDFVQGTRGTGAREDQGSFELASQIVSQGAAYYLPPVDIRSGQAITYRLEPFLPMISYTDRRLPGQPFLPLQLPGGEVCVFIHRPDGSSMDLGCDTFQQSFNRTKTTRAGRDLNVGTVQLDDVYSLMGPGDQFRVTFEQYGHHVVEMVGTVVDAWGNIYEGGGSYDVWVAYPLDMEMGTMPGTPLTVGDAINPTIQFYPQVAAEVELEVSHYPESNPDLMKVFTVTGQANTSGYFSPISPTITLESPGEFRVDVQALYTDTNGVLYMGSMAWGSVVATPENEAQLRVHGRRGLDSLVDIPNTWFKHGDLSIPQGAISHSFNPYLNGDILWSRMSDNPYGGDSLLIVASLQDTIGTIADKIVSRVNRMHLEVPPPGDFNKRKDNGELPLFSSTRSGYAPQFVLGQIGAQVPEDIDQIAYSYRSSQRPGVRVREIVSEDNQNGGYWRLDTLYDDQLGVGTLGDQENDFKLQYVGAVYRDLDSGLNEYLIQGSGWIFIPDNDVTGSRLMPPFSGPGNGGWTTEGGPVLTLKGQEIHMFLLPTGVRPGAVLEVGDQFVFSGHLMPTLNSQVMVTVTAPGGAVTIIDGQANKIGYFYNPAANFPVSEPGLWTVDVRVWHDGQIGDGSSVDCDPENPFDPGRPCPSGDVLGSVDGRYVFYVATPETPPLALTSPSPGVLDIRSHVDPILISGVVPPGLDDVSVDYTVTMAGYILERGQAAVENGGFSFYYDPEGLHEEFPNLDLVNRDDGGPGLADTIHVGILLYGKDEAKDVYRTNTVLLQGEQVFNNSPASPHAASGGPYSGDEGIPVSLDGSASADPYGIALYRWDCLNDGSWETSSDLPADATCSYGDNGLYTLKLEVVATTGLTDTITTTVEIDNVAPEVFAGLDQGATQGIPLSFSGIFTDTGWLDSHTVHWDFDDGQVITGTLSPMHTFNQAGIFEVTLTVTDDDGGFGSDTLVVTVAEQYALYLPFVIREGS